MKAAFAYWGNRIAPVFDTSRQIHVVESESKRIVAETEVVLADDLSVHKALRLAELGIDTLVCGAISRTLHALIASYGIEVFPFTAGDLREVIQAWLGGKLAQDAFAMPGCCRRRGQGRFWAVPGMIKEEYKMNGRKRGGMGPGGGQGQGPGRGGAGQGRMDGPLAGGAGGTCLCPVCGHSEPNERGVPCMQKQCPKCGTAMTRELQSKKRRI